MSEREEINHDNIQKAIDGLRRCCEAFRDTPPEHWRANMDFLWDKFVTHAATARHEIAQEKERQAVLAAITQETKTP